MKEIKPKKSFLMLLIMTCLILATTTFVPNIPSIESAKPEEYIKGENSLFNHLMFLNQDPPCYPIFNGTQGDNGVFITPVNVTFIFDPEIVAEIYYKIGDGIWILYTEPFVIYEQGNLTLYWYCIDFDGNVSAVAFYILTIDYSKPELSLIIPEKGCCYLFGKRLFKIGNSAPVLIGKNYIDVFASDTFSGIKNVSFSLVKNSKPPETYISETPSYIWELTGRYIGKYTLTVTAYDFGGLSVNTTINMIILQFGIL